MPELRRDVVTVTTPATSANLGPGYDAFGLALGLHDVVSCQVTSAGLDVKVVGEGADDVPRDESHLVVRSIRAAFDVMGVSQPGLRLTCRNEIPHGRGLGSSASAVVTGLTIAGALATEQAWQRSDTLCLATQIEGHPDNVAACIYGGFTIAWGSGQDVGATRLEVHDQIRVHAFVPPEPVSTHTARGLLPAQVSHEDAAFNIGRAALMVAAITQRPELLFAASEDRLHQDFRQPAMPASIDLVARLRARGIPALVSGAGPTVLALMDRGNEPMTGSDGWRHLQLPVDVDGARVDAVPEPRE